MTQQNRSYHLFETALGWVGIAWTERGVSNVQLPESSLAATRDRLLRRLKGDSIEVSAPPRAIAEAINAIKSYAGGEPVDFTQIPVDAEAEPFFHDIWRAARDLGFGETVTYGELAKRAGHSGLARETGQALGANPTPIIVPCHRILAAGGKIGGFSAPGGARTKEKLLALEGVRLGPPPAAQTAFGF